MPLHLSVGRLSEWSSSTLAAGPSVRACNCFMTPGHLTQVHCHRLLLSFSPGTVFLTLWEGTSIKIKKIARRINSLPGRQQRGNSGMLDQLLLFVNGV